MSRSFDWMQNYINDSVYESVRGLIFRNGGSIDDITDYYDGALGSISDDYNFCFYLKVMELPGFHETIRERKLRIAFTENADYAPDINGDFIVLRPIGKTAPCQESKNRAYFNYMLHSRRMLVIRPRKLRETISVVGLQPSVEYRLRTSYGFENDEPRIYVITPDRIGDNEGANDEEICGVIRWVLEEYHTRYGEIEYDIWKIKLPRNSDIRKDASFLYGGYTVDSIAPENLTLVNTVKYNEKFFDTEKLKELNLRRK